MFMCHVLRRMSVVVLVVVFCILFVASRASAQAAVGFYGPGYTGPTGYEYAFGPATTAPTWQPLASDGFAYIFSTAQPDVWASSDGVLALRVGGDVFSVSPHTLASFASFSYVSVFLASDGTGYIDYAEGVDGSGDAVGFSGSPNDGTLSAGNPFLPAPGAAALLGLSSVLCFRRSTSDRLRWR